MTELGDHATGSATPTWSLQPFKDFIDYVERLNQIMHMSMRGISMLRASPGLIKAVAKAEDALSESSTAQQIRKAEEEAEDALSKPSTEQKIEWAEEEAELAKREVDEGFPILHAQATVALWGALENAIRLFITRWLENFPGALQAEAVQRLRVSIGIYESLQGEDRFFYILDQLERELSAPLRSGVTRFETLLEPFQLSGPIQDSLGQNLFELSQVRNVLVHRVGKADRRLNEACPWLGFAVGDPVTITDDAFLKYSESVLVYVTQLIVRIRERFGDDMTGLEKLEAASE